MKAKHTYTSLVTLGYGIEQVSIFNHHKGWAEIHPSLTVFFMSESICSKVSKNMHDDLQEERERWQMKNYLNTVKRQMYL